MTDRQIFRNDFVNNACGRKFSQNMMFVRDGKVRDGFYYLEAFISKKLICSGELAPLKISAAMCAQSCWKFKVQEIAFTQIRIEPNYVQLCYVTKFLRNPITVLRDWQSLTVSDCANMNCESLTKIFYLVSF